MEHRPFIAVYRFEQRGSIVEAIWRERSLEKYRREWKINLIERDNPGWEDLGGMLF